MAIKETKVWVTLNPGNIKYYEELGYEIPRNRDKYGRLRIEKGTKICIKINDLQNGSNAKVTKICDDCDKEIKNQSYQNIIIKRNNGDGKDRCKKCGNISMMDKRKNNIKYENSLEYYALNNNQEYLLKEFSVKNKKRPNEITYGTQDKYLWICKDCNSEYDMRMSDKTLKDSRCPYCSSMRTNHTNCIATTHPHIAKLLSYPERGYEITAQSNKRESFTCPECDGIKHSKVNNITNKGFSCSKCSDGISYPEKFMMSMLNQLNIKYDTQKRFKWSDNKKYDFYISPHIIIETHGEQHYQYTGFSRTAEEEKENDLLKMKLASENGIEYYIVIDCRKSKIEWIKESILNSELSKLFDLNNIDWLKCHEFACKSLVKDICNLWSDRNKTIKEISNIMRLSTTTIRTYLKRGTKIGLCSYDPIEERVNSGINAGKRKKKKVIQLTIDGKYIKEWNSIVEAGDKLNITPSNITTVCSGTRNSSGGFKWKYADDYYKQLNNA